MSTANDSPVRTMPGNNENQIFQLMFNSYLSGRAAMAAALDPSRSRAITIDSECKYPEVLTINDFKYMWERNGVAQKVVSIYPEECWTNDPEVYENEKPKQTDWDISLDDIVSEHQLWATLEELDVLSGIGCFGVMVIGLDDQKDLHTPVEGVVNESRFNTPTAQRNLLYLKCHSEINVKIDTWEENPTSERYGKPVLYSVTMEANRSSQTQKDSQNTGKQVKVHWTRVIHLKSDGNQSRLHSVYNNLLDLKKVGGGSAEMFWRGAFPGIAFEINPEFIAAGATIDPDKMRDEFANYSEGLQRYLAMVGVTAKSMAPMVVDPMPHIDAIIRMISIAKRIPKRILEGSEAAVLASSQDAKGFNKRLNRRCRNYCSPIIRQTIDRLISCGVLPFVEDYEVEWVDLNSSTNQEKVDNSKSITETLAKFVQGGVEGLISPKMFMLEVLQWDEDVVDQVVADMEKRVKDMLGDNPEDLQTDANGDPITEPILTTTTLQPGTTMTQPTTTPAPKGKTK
jgi:uncharacterized protein